jgi:septal ring factor EnvC (AmiA/AmiB activator)
MLTPSRKGVTVVEGSTRSNIDWISDLVIKALCGACTILLAVAVSSLQSMNSEIKTLSENVFELSSQSKVLNVTIANLERRLEKLEHDTSKKP